MLGHSSTKLDSLWQQLQTKLTSYFAKHRIFSKMNELKTCASSIYLLGGKKKFLKLCSSEEIC